MRCLVKINCNARVSVPTGQFGEMGIRMGAGGLMRYELMSKIKMAHREGYASETWVWFVYIPREPGSFRFVLGETCRILYR